MNPTVNSTLNDWLTERYPNAQLCNEADTNPSYAHFGDSTDEYESLTSTCALLPNEELGFIRVEGPDAADYLHRRLSNAIKGLGENRGTHALQLGGDGKLLAEMLVYRRESGFDILTPAAWATQTAEDLDKFVLMDDVQVRLLSDEIRIVSLIGPQAPDALSKFSEASSSPELEFASATLRVGDETVTAFRDSRFSAPCFHLAIPANSFQAILEILFETVESAEGSIAGRDAFEFYRIGSGMPRFGVDTTPDTIPLEAGLAKAISLNKGCYPGQEVIATITNLGHPAKVLRRATVDKEVNLSPANEITLADGGVLTATSSATLPGLNRTLVLGYVPWKHRDATDGALDCDGQNLQVEIEAIA